MSFLILVKPLTTENTENKTTPKICKITVFLSLSLIKSEGEMSDNDDFDKTQNLFWNVQDSLLFGSHSAS